MDGIRRFLNTKAGLATCGVLAVVGLIVIVLSLKSAFGDSVVASNSKARIAVCSETGKSFEIELEPGMKFPVKSPYSGKNTGYLATESCNWTADGQVSSTKTWVLLNHQIGKTGPTFCPTCHRLVVKNNPVARAGDPPPPTEAEYAAKKGQPKESAE